MKYRVVFRDRSNRAGEKADDPASFLEAQLNDESIVIDSTFVGRLDPEAQHSSDIMEEDDAFLGLGTEIWEYDVADGRDQEFKDALLNSGVVMEYEELESGDTLDVS